MQRKVQRKASGGGAPASVGGASAASGPDNAAVAETAKRATSGSGAKLPYLDRIQASFGAHDVSDARVHANTGAAQAAADLGAMAFTHGDHIAVGTGTDLLTIAEEAAHVVQQRGGNGPSGAISSESDSMEHHAKAVAQRVVAGKSAVDLLDKVASPGDAGGATGVQCRRDPPKKEVSATAMRRLGAAKAGINVTKQALPHGAGNQLEALQATNFNSYFRMAAMRDSECWQITSAARQLAAKYPDALVRAKAEMAGGGNCGEHAMVAFDYLRTTAGDTVNRAAKAGLDHAFVVIGDTHNDTDKDLVVCDPWPTAPTACLWEDHFAYTRDRTKLEVSNTVTGDDQEVVSAIRAGLTLSQKGTQMIEYAFDEERTKAEIEKGREGDKPWIWSHADAAGEGKHYDYHTKPEVEQQDAQVDDDLVHQQDEGFSRYMAWLRQFAQ